MNVNKTIGSLAALMSCFVFAAVAIQFDPISGQGGLEIQAQNSAGGNRTIDLMVDELLANYSVLSELAQ
jgi:hypothetical protein